MANSKVFTVRLNESTVERLRKRLAITNAKLKFEDHRTISSVIRDHIEKMASNPKYYKMVTK